MERTQPKVVYSPFLEGNKFLHHINYLSSIENAFYGTTVNHELKISYLRLLLKYSTVLANPVSASIFGDQPNSFLASEISGFRCLGSSWGRGRYTIFDFDFVIFIIMSARAEIVISTGFPRFTGPVKLSGVSINVMSPSIKSSTY